MKHIKSTDPRKKKITDALKKKSGGTKVTLVREIALGTFEGHCQKMIGDKYHWESLGMFQVTAQEAGVS